MNVSLKRTIFTRVTRGCLLRDMIEECHQPNGKRFNRVRLLSCSRSGSASVNAIVLCQYEDDIRGSHRKL